MNKCMGCTQNFVHSAHYQDCKIGVLTICLVLIGRNNQGKQKKTGMNLQKVSVTYRIIDKQVKNTTKLCNIIVQYI